ncbi:MAG TPA: SAM-dependent methyltransferase [Rickettsiales bacterium]|nr:SAM-dependent methyltransferase [Rickettsiales bacterium]
MKILASAQENSINCAIKEVREKFNVLKVEKLSKGVFVFETDDELGDFKPIFVRYLLQIYIEKPLDELNIADLFKNLSKDDIFVFHLSVLDDSVSKDNVLADCLKYFKENNIKINPKEASKIIGLVIFENKVYFGVSTIKESLSSWPLGECRFKYEEEQVSRAEFKLLEALEYFNIDLSKYKNAIDLGAAPGGWTRILLNKGLNVIAVDPAELDNNLTKNKNLYHYRGLSQDFFRKNKNKFDIIVNDMKVDTKKSIQITEEAMRYLNKNGVVIMTLKLNPNREFEEVKECMKIISEKYNIVGVHQLFHNRSEATIIFKNKI